MDSRMRPHAARLKIQPTSPASTAAVNASRAILDFLNFTQNQSAILGDVRRRRAFSINVSGSRRALDHVLRLAQAGARLQKNAVRFGRVASLSTLILTAREH
jgi:hypothetical protein